MRASLLEPCMKATWNGVTLAESDDTVVVEGNHYFPEASLKREYVTFSNHRTSCPYCRRAAATALLILHLHLDSAQRSECPLRPSRRSRLDSSSQLSYT